MLEWLRPLTSGARNILDDIRPHHVEGHGRVKVEILAAAFCALKMNSKHTCVMLTQPCPELAPLAFVVGVALVELLVRRADDRVHLGRQALPGGECLQLRLELLRNVPRLCRRHLLEEDVAHVLPAVELVDAERSLALGRAHLRDSRQHTAVAAEVEVEVEKIELVEKAVEEETEKEVKTVAAHLLPALFA